MAIPVLLDCDPGHDDALAIMLAAASPAIDLLGITTVAGNQTLAKTTLNARRVPDPGLTLDKAIGKSSCSLDARLYLGSYLSIKRERPEPRLR